MVLTLKKFFWLLGKEKKYFLYLIIPFIFISFLEALSIALIIPLLNILSGETISDDRILSLFDKIPDLNNFSVDIILSLIILFLFSFKNIFHFFLNKFFFSYCFKIQSLLRIKILNKINENYFTYKYTLSEINKLIAFSTERFANNSMIPIMQSVPDFALFIFLIGLLGYQQPIAMLIMIVVLLISFIFFILFFKKKYVIWGKKYNTTSKNILSNTSNALNGIEELKILGKDYFFNKVSQKYSESFAFYAVKYRLFQKLPRQFVEIIILSSIIIIFLLSHNYNLKPSNIFLNLTLFGIVGIRLIPVFGSILSTLNEIRFSKNSIDELHKILYYKSKKIEETKNLLVTNKFSKIEIKNLKIKNINKIFTKGINLKIYKNNFIGIYGKSGVGKSTLLKCITGINFSQISGKIFLNEKRLDSSSIKNLTSKAYLVKQDPLFFEGSIKNNIAIGYKNDEINSKKIKKCLELSGCDFVLKNKKNINLFVNQNATNFSAGQKQRLAIARALYNDREILLFDEITSNLDNKNTKNIINLIKKLSQKKTIILVSHDLEFLSICKIIFELKEDEIIKKNYDKKLKR